LLWNHFVFFRLIAEPVFLFAANEDLARRVVSNGRSEGRELRIEWRELGTVKCN
jgi:hypothetical protein